MSTIHLTREHALGRPQARQLASRWAAAAEQHLGLRCRFQEGDGADRLAFERAGVHGVLTVTEDRFVVEARLGLLLAAFRHRIEHEIAQKLDQLLAHDEPLAAFDEAVARRAARGGHSRKGG